MLNPGFSRGPVPLCSAVQEQEKSQAHSHRAEQQSHTTDLLPSQFWCTQNTNRFRILGPPVCPRRCGRRRERLFRQSGMQLCVSAGGDLRWGGREWAQQPRGSECSCEVRWCASSLGGWGGRSPHHSPPHGSSHLILPGAGAQVLELWPCLLIAESLCPQMQPNAGTDWIPPSALASGNVRAKFHLLVAHGQVWGLGSMNGHPPDFRFFFGEGGCARHLKSHLFFAATAFYWHASAFRASLAAQW